jgi:large subunit ribosomal protein L6
MSRIGKMPIRVPDKVTVDLNGTEVVVSGAKGSLTRTFNPEMKIEKENGTLVVSRSSDSQQQRALHGLTRSLLNNMVVGVSQGFTKKLIIEGVGYRADMDGKVLVLMLGYSHPVRFEPPAGISFAVEDKGKAVLVNGSDKELVGEITAQIRKKRPPEPYKGKGVRYEKEVVRRKAGKTGKV